MSAYGCTDPWGDFLLAINGYGQIDFVCFLFLSFKSPHIVPSSGLSGGYTANHEGYFFTANGFTGRVAEPEPVRTVVDFSRGNLNAVNTRPDRRAVGWVRTIDFSGPKEDR